MNAFARLAPFVLCLSTSPEPTAIAFAPKEGVSVRKTFTTETEMEFDELIVVVAGEGVPSEMLPEIELTVTEEQELSITDVYEKVAEGRPARLVRTFDEISYTAGQVFSMIGSDGNDAYDAEATGESPLAGKTVVFEWDEGEEEFVANYAEDEDGDADALAGLVEDMDLRVLLPDGKVEVGDTWELEAGDLATIFEPGGDLSIAKQGDTDATWEGIKDNPEDSGTVLLTFKGTEEEDGRTLAIIELEGEVEHTAEGEGDLTRVPVAEGDATQRDTVSSELEGRLRWDLEAGLPASFDLEVSLRMSSNTKLDDPPAGAEYEHTLVMVGTSNLSVEFEAVE